MGRACVVVLGVAATSGAFAWTILTLSRLYVNAPYQKPFAIGTALLLTAGAFALNKFLRPITQRADNISFKIEDANEAVQTADADTKLSTLPETKHREGRDGVRVPPSKNHSTLSGSSINRTPTGATSTRRVRDGVQGAPPSTNNLTGTAIVTVKVPGSNNKTGNIVGQIAGNGNFTGTT